MYFAAGILALQLATAEPATAPPVPAASSATIPEDWAAAPPPSRKAIDNAVREIVAEEKAKHAATPERNVSLRAAQSATLEARFEEAVVPGCLQPDGLKRQPTSIGPFGVSGVLALPLILVAKLRGKCQ
jgi:hypothetical protein